MIEILSVVDHLSNKTWLGRDFFFQCLQVLLKIFSCSLVFRGQGTIFIYMADSISVFTYSFSNVTEKEKLKQKWPTQLGGLAGRTLHLGRYSFCKVQCILGDGLSYILRGL